MKIKAELKARAEPAAAPGEPAGVAPAEPAPGKKKWKKGKNRKPLPDGTVIRSITLPVARPVGRTWEEVRALLGRAMREARDLHNWAARMIVRVDRFDCAAVRPLVNGKQKLPPMPKVQTKGTEANDLIASLTGSESFYLAARQQAPTLNCGTVSQILDDVVSQYKDDRMEVFQGKRSLRVYKARILPARMQEAKSHPLCETEDGGLELGFPFYTETGAIQWITWRLRSGGGRYGRAAAGARAVARGQAEARTVYLIEKERKDKKGTELFAKVVARFQADARHKEAKGDMLVSTHADGLLRYYMDGDDHVSWLRYDHVRRLLAQRSKRQGRIRDDVRSGGPIVGSARQRRRQRAKRARMYEGLERRVDGINRALDDAVKCAAKELVAAAVRRRSLRLVYRDVVLASTDDGSEETIFLESVFAPDFKWFALRQRVETLCKEHSIEFVHDLEARLVPLEPELATEEAQEARAQHELIRQHCAGQAAEEERRQAQPAGVTANESAGDRKDSV